MMDLDDLAEEIYSPVSREQVHIHFRKGEDLAHDITYNSTTECQDFLDGLSSSTIESYVITILRNGVEKKYIRRR